MTTELEDVPRELEDPKRKMRVRMLLMVRSRRMW